ncbi:MAG: NAD(P)/FAD-dependent oxidoreductase [Chloroflexi bacterium]|nr:NAD(P)/FAD-dependent oxidoreductase [Chloroflexota bacterium]
MRRVIYDVIVVGAGPAGSTAARECAARGLKTLIVDKAAFPRDKPCGGGLMVRTAREMNLDITPVVERTISTARMVRRSGRVDSVTSDVPLCLMTQRLRLDAFLVERAQEAGASLREKTAIRGIEQGIDLAEIASDSEPLSARVVIGADGANGTTARMAGMRPDMMQAVALEANIRPAGGVPPDWETAGGVYSIGCPGGYGWIFPKGDHLNVGVAGWAHVAPTLRRRLHELTATYGFAPSSLQTTRGHHIPFRRAGSPLVSGRIMLVGDAGGLADPLTGDGIYSAVVSGRAASVSAFEFLAGETPDLCGYQRSMESGLAASVQVAMQVHDLVHLGMDQFFWSVARVPVLWRACRAIARGDVTYRSAKEKLGPYGPVIDLGANLVRVVPWLQRRTGRTEKIPPERFWQDRNGSSGARPRPTRLGRDGSGRRR